MNLEQIAQRAGVSHTAVSLALRGKPGVSPGTRKRILKLVRELGYQRNGPASALVSGKTGFIGVVPGWTDPMEIGDWDRRILNGLGRVLAAAGKNMIFLLEPKSDDVPSVIGQRYVEGAVFMMEPHASVAAWMAERQVPMVTANFTNSEDTDRVMHDDPAGVRMAIEHLAALGHRRIAYVNSSYPAPFPDPSSRIRLEAYVATMNELGLEMSPGAEDRLEPHVRMEQLFATDRPTAILCFNDHLAMMAMQWLWEHDISIPDQVSVVGIDNVFGSEWTHPPLTSVRLHFEEMGRQAGELLLDRIAEPVSEPRQLLLTPELVVRKSTAPPPSKRES